MIHGTFRYSITAIMEQASVICNQTSMLMHLSTSHLDLGRVLAGIQVPPSTQAGLAPDLFVRPRHVLESADAEGWYSINHEHRCEYSYCIMSSTTGQCVLRHETQ